MVSPLDAKAKEACEWLIRKDGYFYRPNKSGYTTSKFEAGRYTENDARREAEIEPWHMKAIHESEWPDDRPSVAVASLNATITAQAERIAELDLLYKALAELSEHNYRMASNRAEAAEAEVRTLREALTVMVYETTHLSPEEDDGSHWCKISAAALDQSRAALRAKEP